MQAVDELIDSLITRLEASPEVLDNTYIIYTTDNGYHIGQHRLPPGKTCGIETDVNIPFIIRGPGVARGEISSVPTSHTDIVPTIFQLAGIPLHHDFDGEPIPVKSCPQEQGSKSEHVNIEFWGEFLQEGNEFYSRPDQLNNTYKAVRLIGEDYNLLYTVWCTNEIELYDMAVRTLSCSFLALTGFQQSKGMLSHFKLTYDLVLERSLPAQESSHGIALC